IGAGIRRQVVISKAAADINGYGRVGNAVIEGRSVRIAVEVNRVLLEQVRPHDHADVGERQEELVVFVDGHQRGRYVPVHDADVDDVGGVDVPIDAAGGEIGTG